MTRPEPDADRCPCLSGRAFESCCGPLLNGERRASTAEQLMRSRFTAFARGDSAYLLDTWHSTTRPATIELDPSIRWYRLDVGQCLQGGIFDREGVVAFRAWYRSPDGPGEQYEVSRFVREKKQWRYLGPQ